MTDFPTLPPLPANGREIYDMLMKEIEPELMHDHLPLLAEKYKNEKPEATKVRAKRYKEAFARFEAELKAYTEKTHADIHSYKRKAVAYIEERSRQREEAAMDASLEEQFSTL